MAAFVSDSAANDDTRGCDHCPLWLKPAWDRAANATGMAMDGGTEHARDPARRDPSKFQAQGLDRKLAVADFCWDETLLIPNGHIMVSMIRFRHNTTSNVSCRVIQTSDEQA